MKPPQTSFVSFVLTSPRRAVDRQTRLQAGGTPPPGYFDLQWVCEQLDVSAADVIAFGDEWNDITMLEWAGRGVAMGNADARVRAAANEVAPSNMADGVAVVLERLLG